MKNSRMICLMTLVLVLELSGCEQPQPTPPPTEACRCTLDIQFLLVQVVDQHERPITGLEISIINKHTGQAYDTARMQSMQKAIPDGWYVVFSDHLMKQIDPSGEAIIVIGEKDGLSFKEEFVFDTDECGCHVRKIAGPDTIVLSEWP
jgi:hypothetical protein